MHRPLERDWESYFGRDRAAPIAPTETTQQPAGSSNSPSSTVGPACKQCQGAAGSILYGKYGYYFKCSGCDSNTSIHVDYAVPGHKARIRKDGTSFYRECEACGSRSIYHRNQG